MLRVNNVMTHLVLRLGALIPLIAAALGGIGLFLWLKLPLFDTKTLVFFVLLLLFYIRAQALAAPEPEGSILPNNYESAGPLIAQDFGHGHGPSGDWPSQDEIDRFLAEQDDSAPGEFCID